jgi:DNA (cytosine-5)-methyltransferase 1
MNYYNEIDPKAAAWLRELIKQGHIPNGVVDERSITEIKPHELTEYTQCHFFAGIGGWSLALQLAGWPATRPVWTGSCPCQPFSSSGKQLGDKDERHLWPIFFDLIRECRPECVFGEQVASAIGKGWLDGVSADLEGAGYACGATVLGAHSIGSPHIRQRLFWVAYATGGQREQCLRSCGDDVQRSADDGATGGMADAELWRRERIKIERCTGILKTMDGEEKSRITIGAHSASSGGMADAEGEGLQGRLFGREDEGRQAESGHPGRGSATGNVSTGGVVNPVRKRGCCGTAGVKDAKDVGESGQISGFDGSKFWSDFDLIPCRDGKTRRIEPGSSPLAHGVPARVVRLRGYGNAIVPQVAAAFVQAFVSIS